MQGGRPHRAGESAKRRHARGGLAASAATAGSSAKLRMRIIKQRPPNEIDDCQVVLMTHGRFGGEN